MWKDEIKSRWIPVCEEYVQAFIEKNSFSESSWVNGDVGGHVIFDGDIVLSMDDVRFDVDNSVCAGKIREYWEYIVKLSDLGLEENVSYENFCKGRLPYTSEQLKTISVAYKRLKKAEQDYLSVVKSRGDNVGSLSVYGKVRDMNVGEFLFFPFESWQACRCAAHVAKKTFGALFEVHRVENRIMVERKA